MSLSTHASDHHYKTSVQCEARIVVQTTISFVCADQTPATLIQKEDANVGQAGLETIAGLVSKHEFQLSLANRFAILAAEEDVNAEEQPIGKAIVECAEALGSHQSAVAAHNRGRMPGLDRGEETGEVSRL